MVATNPDSPLAPTGRIKIRIHVLLVGRMEKRKKRARGSNWNHAQTMALAELKREASLTKDYGPLVWERIAHTLSSRFPGQIRTGAQCRRRWDTLVKVYNHIEDYCVVTGQDHRELDEGELASMELATAYHQDWYDIVEQVCSQRKSKESCDGDLRLAKRSKGSSPGSHYFELPERPDSLGSASISKSVNYYEQSTPESTTTYTQVSSLEADKLSPEEEVPRLKNGNDGLVLEATQLRQHGQVSHEVSQEPQTLKSANLLPHTSPAENGVQLKEPLQDDLWPSLNDPSFDLIEQPDTKSELTGPFYWDLESVGLGAQPKEPLQDHVRDDSLETANTSKAPNASNALDASDDWNAWNFWKVLYTRNASVASSSSSGVTFFSEPPMLSSAIMTSSTSSRSADSTTSRQSRRWSLKAIVFNVLQCCHASGRKERTEDMEMESKQAALLKEKARKEALSQSRKENVPMMLNASSTSATSATRGDKPLQKQTERISKQAASDKKDEETRSCKFEGQQLGSKSSSKCLPIGKLGAKFSRKLFPAFHGKSSH